MFGPGFVTHIVEPATMGSPAFVTNSVTATGQLLLTHTVAFNAAFASIQLALGAGLLWRRTAKAALAGSVVWALAVWWFGESFGMLLSGMANPLTGAPGAALLYVLIAALAWPRSPRPGWEAGRGLLAARWTRVTWLVLWGGLAALTFQPQLRAPGALRAAIGGLARGEPGWLAAADRVVAGALGSAGPVPVMIFGVVLAAIAIGIFHRATVRPVLVLAAVTALVIWVAGENFGGILTRSGTDPNTGLLLLMLVAACWPARLADEEIATRGTRGCDGGTGR